ncbi:MAG: hypothetical protein Q8N23_11225 [Archangium sp.]|nr:hypothetical protein [Archangium sp.]MDP3153235.1 hypothetical protein [Archangium sp.]MDP3570269.1 hypothetical protein [Archangium sp.]
MNRALFLTLFFAAACGPERIAPEPEQTPAVEPPPAMTTVDPLTGFPCDVRQVLQANCASCHAGVQYVVHFTTREDLKNAGHTVPHLGEEIAVRMRPGATKPMPPYGMPQQPTLAERQLIDGWVQSGMPAGACGPLTKD